MVEAAVGARAPVLVRLLLGGAAGALQTRMLPNLSEVLYALLKVSSACCGREDHASPQIEL